MRRKNVILTSNSLLPTPDYRELSADFGVFTVK